MSAPPAAANKAAVPGLKLIHEQLPFIQQLADGNNWADCGLTAFRPTSAELPFVRVTTGNAATTDLEIRFALE